MSTNNENTQVLEPVAEEEIVTAETPVEEGAAEEVLAPVIKTKKEIKKERKAIKKHKKEIKKEAKMHSAKATKAQKFFLGLLSLIVIASMIFCSYGAVVATMNIVKIAEAAQGDETPDDSEQNNNENNQQNNNTQQNNNQQNNNTDANTNPGTNSEDASSPSGDASTPGDNAPATGDINSKEAAVEYYKKAHAKVLTEAKSVTRTYDRPSNYNGVVEVGGNSTIAGIAKTLMDTFMKENTEAVLHEGSDAIKNNFPPANGSGSAGLTADMISDYKCEEKDGNYILTLTLNSTEEKPDDGTMASHLVDTVEVSQITDAAGDFVALEGFENLYISSTVTATIEKETGKMIALDVSNPSYMCFGKATALGFISVENCKLGLLYEQKWTVQW